MKQIVDWMHVSKAHNAFAVHKVPIAGAALELTDGKAGCKVVEITVETYPLTKPEATEDGHQEPSPADDYYVDGVSSDI